MQQKDNDIIQPIEIFLCYAREDETLLRGLEKQLQALRRQGMISLWHDRNISVGAEWEQEITHHLHTARIILLLVSPDFMDSDYCYGVEMQQAMVRHASGEARVIPIILRPVYWQKAPFGKLQAFPKDAQPVVSPYWHSRDEAFFNIAEGIRQVVEELISSLQQAVQEQKAEGAYEAKRRKDLDANISITQTLQLECMLFEYGIDIERKRLGIEIQTDFGKLRDSLKESIKKDGLVFSTEEIVASYERTGFYQKMYSQLSDAALAVNDIHFPMPTRPQGWEYSCTEQACREVALNRVRKYFPSFDEARKQVETAKQLGGVAGLQLVLPPSDATS